MYYNAPIGAFVDSKLTDLSPCLPYYNYLRAEFLDVREPDIELSVEELGHLVRCVQVKVDFPKR